MSDGTGITGHILRWDILGGLPLRSGSVDMIFTDPPYDRQALPLYGAVAREAARLLRPGGFVAVMAGHLYFDEIIGLFSRETELAYHFTFVLGLSGRYGGLVWRRRMPIAIRTKLVLVYRRRGGGCQRTAMTSLYWGDGADKDFHPWGQDVDSHRYYIDCLTAPGDLVVDPLAGGGTTAVACELIGRRWIVGDIDEVAVETMRKRLGGIIPLHRQEPEQLTLWNGTQSWGIAEHDTVRRP